MLNTRTGRRAAPLALRLPWPSAFELMFAAFVLATTVAGIAAGAEVGRFLSLLAGLLISLAVVSVAVTWATGLDARLARMMAGVALTFCVYGALSPLLQVVSGRTIDDALMRMELEWLGTLLPIVLQPYTSDALTWLFGLAYAIHVPLFFAPALLHWRDGHPERAERILLTLAVAMYLGFVGYALFPAYGPVGTLSDLRPLGTNAATQVVADYGIALGTFPSLHAGVSFAVALDGWRTSWRRGLLFTAAMVLVWASTIYLRYHWVPDLVAGAGLALIAGWLAGPLQALTRRLAR